MELHVHVWDPKDPNANDPIEEVNLEHTGTYINRGAADPTDHIQFSGMVQGKNLEVRLFVKDIEYLIEEAQHHDPGIAAEQHRKGFAAGKEQRDHDIKRALEEIKQKLTGTTLQDQTIKEVEQILKKYTEA